MSDTSNTTNPEYYVKRAADERAIADQCEDNRVGAIHLEMATKYDERAARYKDGKRPLRVDG